MLKNIEAVIFDLDGTITDSMAVWEEIDRVFFAQRGIEIPAGFQEEIEGMSFSETAEYFRRRFSLPETEDELKKIWNKMAREKYGSDLRLKSGVIELLAHLKKVGIRTAIATSNSDTLLEIFMRARGLCALIDVSATGCMAGAGKPAPDVYLLAARKLGTDPSRCLVFEDVPMGILAGKRAGMRVCAVEDVYSHHMRDEKKRLADYYITDFSQVLNGDYEDLGRDK